MLQVQAKPGKYRFRLEKIGPQICKFNILDTRVAYGDAKIIDNHTFEILDEDYENK
jgi:hypothetical protein